MARVFYLHWNADEAAATAALLRAAGHTVDAHHSADTAGKSATPPEAWVISLDRLPSHGRAVAEWIVEAKSRREIPLIFAGGAPDKIAATRAKFPNAVYCAAADLEAAIERATATRVPAAKPATRRKRRAPAAPARRVRKA